jgi:hypothetical protein
MDIEKLRAWLDTDEGKADLQKYIEECNGTDEFTQNRYRRFEAWLQTNDFDNLMYRLILEHGDEYQEKCYHEGSMPYPNNKLQFLLNYIEHNFEPVSVRELDTGFANEIYEFRGYYFQHIHGQGVITKIFNKDDNRELLMI